MVGNSPKTRVMDFLLEGRELDYSLSDIARNSSIGWTTLHRIWNDLEKFEIVKSTRNIGRAKLYRLNLENQTVKKLIQFYDQLLILETEKTLSKISIKR